MILITILTIIVGFLIYFVTAKRFKLKRLILSICFKTIYNVFKKWWLKFSEEGLKTIVFKRLSKFLKQPYHCNNNIVEYEFHNKKYKLMVNQSLIKKPSYFILNCKEGTGKKEDITLKLQPWIGPEHNFHNTLIKPSDLGYKKLIVVFSIGNKVVVNENDFLPTKLT